MTNKDNPKPSGGSPTATTPPTRSGFTLGSAGKTPPLVRSASTLAASSASAATRSAPSPTPARAPLATKNLTTAQIRELVAAIGTKLISLETLLGKAVSSGPVKDSLAIEDIRRGPDGHQPQAWARITRGLFTVTNNRDARGA